MWIIAVLSLIFSAGVAPGHTRVAIPSGTTIYVKLDQGISSKDAKRNHRVKAQIAQDVLLNGKAIIPRGAPVAAYVARVHSARGAGKAALFLRIDAITVDGRAYPVVADHAGSSSAPEEKSPVPHPAKPAIGAKTPARAKDNRSAAMGGAAGAAENTGVAAQLSDTGEISFPDGSTLSFRLKKPLRVRVRE